MAGVADRDLLDNGGSGAQLPKVQPSLARAMSGGHIDQLEATLTSVATHGDLVNSISIIV